MIEPIQRRALVSGASIAGPALGYWLTRNGWSVTLVERSAHVRGGGYPIDLRGTAVQVAKRMGIYDDVRRHQVGRRSTRILNRSGRRIATMDLSAELLNDEATGDVELPRGDLAKVLYELTRDRVDYVFNESVATVTPHENRVDVTFVSGRSDSFDIVVGADGIHSTTRRLVFGPEADYIKHLGAIVAIWDMDEAELSPCTGTMYSIPGCTAMHMRENTGPARGFMAFIVDDPGAVDLDDTKSAPRLARQAFDGHLIPVVQQLLADLEHTDDVFYDTVSQIHIDSWHRGRVVLVGDSAYAPSFLSGQGTSIALIGAFVLASELVASPDPEMAFTAYEAKIREFVERNQAIAVRKNTNAIPRDSEALRKRNLKLWALPWLKRMRLLKLLDRGYRATPTSLTIEGYGLT
jgi:2-polyprenyl-6-methoxyphenol hydroxylase-like FAD-dependent oxidoreductase